jgi:hypothetical protein
VSTPATAPLEQAPAGAPSHAPEARMWRLMGGRVLIGPRAGWRKLAPHAAALVALTVLLGGLSLLTPSPDHVGTHQQLGFPPCSFRAVLGLPCPGCGGTTSVCYMLHGRVGDALIASIFGTAVFLALAVVWLTSAFALVARMPVSLSLEGRDAARVVAYSVALMLVSWVVKIALTLLHPPGVPG